MNSKNAVILARETCEMLFYRAALLRLGRVRELVREINDQHVGTQFIITRQPAVKYPSAILLYQNNNNIRDLQSITMHTLRYGRYVWNGTSEVFTGETRVNLKRSKQKIFMNAIMTQPKIVLNPIKDFDPNH